MAVAVVLLAAACSDDDSSSSSATTGGAAALTKSTIKVGFVAAITNATGVPDRWATPVVKAWQSWTNDNGGINGHPVQVVLKDTKNDPSTAQQVAKDLAEGEGVVALISQDSAQDNTVGDYLVAQKVPVIGANGFATNFYGKSPLWFPTTTNIPAAVQGQLVSAQGVGAKSFGVISCAEVPACSAAEPVYAPTAAALGLKYAGLVKGAFSQPNYTAECLQLKNNGADFVQVSATAQLGVRMYNDCLRQQYEPFYGASGTSFTASDFKDAPDMRLAGGIFSFPWWVDAAPVKQFRDAMSKYSPDGDIKSGSATGPWQALQLFAKALASAPDTPTRTDVLNGLYAFKGENLDGLLPQKMTYSPDKGTLVNCFLLYKQLKAGSPERVDNGTPSGNGVNGDLKSQCYPAATGT